MSDPTAGAERTRKHEAPRRSRSVRAAPKRSLFRRRRVLVLPGLQLQIVLSQTAGAILFAFVLIIAIVGPDVATLLSPEITEEKYLRASERLLVLHGVVWPSVLLGMLFLVGLSLAVSHRIAGPLYRFGVALRSLRSGRVPLNISLRKRDFLHAEAETVNAMLDGVRTHLEGVGDRQRALSDAFRAIRARARGGVVVEPQAWAEVSARLDELEEQLYRFQIEVPEETAKRDGAAG